MGRMKELYMHIMQVNEGIPEEITIGDMRRMKELEIYQWEQYEREQEKIRLQQFKSENPGKVAEAEQAEKFVQKHLERKEQIKNSQQ
jgi:hypothetical protein